MGEVLFSHNSQLRDTINLALSREYSPTLFGSIIEGVEKAEFNTSGFDSRLPRQRGGTCRRVAEKMTLAFTNAGYSAQTMTIDSLNALRGLEQYQTEGHVVTVVQSNDNKKYLVDVGVCQFLEVESQFFRRNDLLIITPVGKQLLQFGFMEINDASLCEYLDWLSEKTKNGLLRPVTNGITQRIQIKPLALQWQQDNKTDFQPKNNTF